MTLSDWAARSALVVQAYPEAKRALIAQGRPAVVIEAMPAVQVATLYTYQTYQEYRDDVLSSGRAFLITRLTGAWMRRRGATTRFLRRRPFLKLFAMFLPAIQSSFPAAVRVDRQFDAIQCIEAIRMYAATHPGFPARLEDITEAPVPLDPMTGQPFSYRVDGDRATLIAGSARCPPAPDVRVPVRVETGPMIEEPRPWNAELPLHFPREIDRCGQSLRL